MLEFIAGFASGMIALAFILAHPAKTRHHRNYWAAWIAYDILRRK